MKVTVRGVSGVFHTLDLNPQTDVRLLRQRLEDIEGIEASRIHLCYAGQTLQDGRELQAYALEEYNLSGESVIYMQVALGEPFPICLGSYASLSSRITEFVEVTATVADVVDLLHDHQIALGMDPSHMIVVCKRTSGTTITDVNFSVTSTIEQMVREVSAAEGVRVKHLTFIAAQDGNVHVYCDYTKDRDEHTILFPRPVEPFVMEPKKGMLTAVMNKESRMVTLEHLKHQVCLQELRHPPNFIKKENSMDLR
ncbi:unnamed protein product [Pedinophyceae sp. YPF-701]|nr:unnamed protein product [Pedinophyceae sp. YPF-701]